MQLGQRVGNAVLAQVVAGRHLAAEAVAPVLDRHLAGLIGRRLDQHRHAEIGEPQRVGDGALVAEVRQRDDHAVDAVAIGLEQRGALLGVVEGLDHAEPRVLGRQHDRVVALVGENFDDLLAPRFGQQGRGRNCGCRRSRPSSSCDRSFHLPPGRAPPSRRAQRVSSPAIQFLLAVSTMIWVNPRRRGRSRAGRNAAAPPRLGRARAQPAGRDRRAAPDKSAKTYVVEIALSFRRRRRPRRRRRKRRLIRRDCGAARADGRRKLDVGPARFPAARGQRQPAPDPTSPAETAVS